MTTNPCDFQFVDQHQYYLPLDVDFLVDTMKNNMDDLARNWRMMGRPTCICPINGSMLGVVHSSRQLPSVASAWIYMAT